MKLCPWFLQSVVKGLGKRQWRQNERSPSQHSHWQRKDLWWEEKMRKERKNEPVSATTQLVGVQMEQWDDILLSISSHSCCHQQATAEGDSERDKDASREMDKTERKGRRDDEKGRCDERLLTCTFASAYYFYSLPFNCCCYILPVLPVSSPPTISALVFPSSLSAEADIGHAPPAGSSKVCGGGPAVSNEIPSVRFQTSTRSFAYSGSGTKWWTGKGSS